MAESVIASRTPPVVASGVDASAQHRRRRDPRPHPRAGADRDRGALGQAHLGALRPDRRDLDGRHPRLRPLRPRPAARGAARRALRGRGPEYLRPLRVAAHPQRRGPPRREVRRRRARPCARALPVRQAACRDKARSAHSGLQHGRSRPLLLQEPQGPRGGRGLRALAGGPGDLGGPDLLRAVPAERRGAGRRRGVRHQPGDVRRRRGHALPADGGPGAALARHRPADPQAELRRGQELGPGRVGQADPRRGLRRRFGRGRLPAPARPRRGALLAASGRADAGAATKWTTPTSRTWPTCALRASS